MKTIPRCEIHTRWRDVTTAILPRIGRRPVTPESGWRYLREQVRANPDRYAPDSPHRLVLLATTRTESDR